MRLHPSELSLLDYWRTFSVDISRSGNWSTSRNSKGDIVCGTLIKYDKSITRLSQYLPSIPISELSLYDLQHALSEVKHSRVTGVYSDSTMGGYLSILGDIYKYAQDHGHAYNLIRYLRPPRKGHPAIIDLSGGHSKAKAQAREQLDSGRQLVRSLTPNQSLRLVRVCSKDLLSDGRAAGVLLALYDGVRPAECRALFWKDIHALLDHPDALYLDIYQYRTPDGTLHPGPKTQNGYRRLPVHPELAALLLQRKAYVAQQYGGDIDSLPICCMGNDYTRPCKDYQLASYAAKVLDSLRIPDSQMLPYLLEMVAYGDRHDTLSGDDHLSMYVLRRNYCTWVHGCTRMSADDLRYIMGHDMHAGYVNLREQYNNDTIIYSLWDKLSRHIIDPSLHPLVYDMQPDYTVCLSDYGVVTIRMSQNLIAQGGTLHIRITPKDNSGKVSLNLPEDSPKNIDLRLMQTHVTQMPVIYPDHTIPNTEYANWNAVIKAANKARPIVPDFSLDDS